MKQQLQYQLNIPHDVHLRHRIDNIIVSESSRQYFRGLNEMYRDMPEWRDHERSILYISVLPEPGWCASLIVVYLKIVY